MLFKTVVWVRQSRDTKSCILVKGNSIEILSQKDKGVQYQFDHIYGPEVD